MVGAVAAIGALVASSTATAQVVLPPNFHWTVLAQGGTLTNPDDITVMDGVIYVVYQNGTTDTVPAITTTR